MRLVILVVLCCLGLGTTAEAATPEIMVSIQKFIDSFNKGDAAGAASTHSATEDLAIIDEVPPYLWRGAQAFSAWAAALEQESKEHGMTEQAVTISAATREVSNGQEAYVIVPAVYAFKQNGTAMREEAQMTFVLKKGEGGWLIHSWAWTGPDPLPVSAAK